jgi:hypothetical protein
MYIPSSTMMPMMALVSTPGELEPAGHRENVEHFLGSAHPSLQ